MWIAVAALLIGVLVQTAAIFRWVGRVTVLLEQHEAQLRQHSTAIEQFRQTVARLDAILERMS